MNVRRLFARREGASIAAVARNAFGINVIALGLKFGFQLIYARALGVVGYGRFIYAINWTQLLGPAATLGMVNGVIAYLPAYMEAEDWRAARGILRRSR